MSRRNAALLLVPPLLIVVAWWVLVVGSRSDRFASAETSLEEVRQSMVSTHRELEGARGFTRDAEAATAELRRLSAQIPESMALGDLVLANNLAAGLAGVSIVTFAPDPPGRTGASATAPAGLDVLGADETVTGTADQVNAYLNALRQLDRMDASTNLGRLVVIDRIDQASQGPALVSMNLRLRVFALASPDGP